MSVGIECLLSEDPARARELAQVLDSMNLERQQIERGMERDALAALAQVDLDADVPPALVLYDDSWHQGVVGILASRLKDRYHRPVIAFADVGDGELKGSGRGIEGLHLRDLLATVDARHPGLLGRFGGHAMAAGLSLPAANFDSFADAFRRAVATHAAGLNLDPVCVTDGELAPAELSLDCAETLRYAGPWGQHFPEPLFDGEFELRDQRLVGERHLKMRLRHPDAGEEIDAIAFRVDTERWPDRAVRRVRLAYRLDVNEWRGRRSLQLMVEQLEPC
jgi:single-stranded-DNA-specific exonuclease